MPYTLNGVGTRYSGRHNQSSFQGTCEHCRRAVTITSYDTREFFCVLFIPVIPLRRFRIVNECSSCRRHGRIPLAQFKERLETTLAPLWPAHDQAMPRRHSGSFVYIRAAAESEVRFFDN